LLIVKNRLTAFPSLLRAAVTKNLLSKNFDLCFGMLVKIIKPDRKNNGGELGILFFIIEEVWPEKHVLEFPLSLFKIFERL